MGPPARFPARRRPIPGAGGIVAWPSSARVEPNDEERSCILVVDDDSSIRRLIVSSLRREGYTLTEAQNGEEALEAMRKGNEDLVLLDLMMPGVSGWDVLRIRGASPDLQRIPVIVITAAHGPEAAQAVDSGISALLPKPFDLALLHTLVRRCLTWAHGPDGRHGASEGRNSEH